MFLKMLYHHQTFKVFFDRFNFYLSESNKFSREKVLCLARTIVFIAFYPERKKTKFLHNVFENVVSSSKVWGFFDRFNFYLSEQFLLFEKIPFLEEILSNWVPEHENIIFCSVPCHLIRKKIEWQHIWKNMNWRQKVFFANFKLTIFKIKLTYVWQKKEKTCH